MKIEGLLVVIFTHLDFQQSSISIYDKVYPYLVGN